MATQLSIRQVPWTCRWGRFGGPVEASSSQPHGFVFWVCTHPDAPSMRPLDRGACEECPRWELAAEFEEKG